MTAVAEALQAPVGDVKFAEGKIICGEHKLSLSEAMRLCFAETGADVVGQGFFQPPHDANVPLGSPSPFWEIGVGACEVEVDEATGKVRILKYASLTDAGKAIHPLQCEGQDEGAAMFGLGQALYEDLVYDRGQLLNPNLVDYRLPRFGDLPSLFTTMILEEGGGPGPYGAKGMGEGGILAVAPAICNAVYNATGVRIQQVPINAEELVSALQTRVRRKTG
jgi:CO/xanthine dehydrogenase Mo-binding subunit